VGCGEGWVRPGEVLSWGFEYRVKQDFVYDGVWTPSPLCVRVPSSFTVLVR